MFDKENYQLIELETEQDGVFLGEYETEREAALAYDRAALMIHGDNAETNFATRRKVSTSFFRRR